MLRVFHSGPVPKRGHGTSCREETSLSGVTRSSAMCRKRIPFLAEEMSPAQAWSRRFSSFRFGSSFAIVPDQPRDTRGTPPAKRFLPTLHRCNSHALDDLTTRSVRQV